MSTFLTALFIVISLFITFVLIGLFLMSKLVGGFGNLRAIYRLFTGKGKNTHKRTAKTSSEGESSRTHNHKSKAHARKASADGKMFGQNEGTYVEFEEVKE